MLEAVYVDTVEEKSIVAIRPKPAFQPLFEIATTRAGSGLVSINQTPQTQNEPEAPESCFWWRRGRVGCSQFAKTVGTPISRQDSGACVCRSATPGLKVLDSTSFKVYIRLGTVLDILATVVVL